MLTVGPPEAEEQLRFSVSVGAQHAVLVTNDEHRERRGSRPAGDRARDRRRGARARSRSRPVRPAPVRQRVGRRRRLPGRRPRRAGARPPDRQRHQGASRSPTACSPRAARATPASRCTASRCPAVVGVKEGINLPRYPTLPGPAAVEEGRDRRRSRPTRRAAASRWCSFETPVVEVTETAMLGTGRRRRGRGRRPALRAGPRVTAPVLVLIDHDRGTVDDDVAARRSRSRARACPTRPIAAVVIGGDAPPDGRAAPTRSGTFATPSSPTTRPKRGATRCTSSPSRVQPAAVVATGTERGNEVLAHVAAIADEPFAANVVHAIAGHRRGRSGARAGAAACSRTRRSTAALPILSCALHVFPSAPPAGARRTAGHRVRARRSGPTRRAPASSTGCRSPRASRSRPRRSW